MQKRYARPVLQMRDVRRAFRQGDRGVSALIATHNMDLARGMHRILRLEDGILREVRPADVV